MKAVAPEIRFREKYLEDTDGCWLWTGSIHPKGYGRFKVYGETVGVHRWAHEFFIGPIPYGHDVDHICHSSAPWCADSICKHRKCVNPEHLEAVSRKVHGRRNKNVQKGSCINGHEYTKENTRMYKGGRFCRECNREAARKSYMKGVVTL